MVYQMPSNLINSSTGTGLFSGIALWAYNVTGGFFWTGMLLTFCVVLFISTAKFNTPRAFGFASFIGMMGSIFLAIGKLMPWWVCSAFILVGVIGIVGMVISEK